MTKIIALQSNNPALLHKLQEHGYKVMDMYEAHHQRTIVDAYLYTTYHPDVFTTYNSLAEASDIILVDTVEINQLPTTIMLNITHLEPEEVLLKLERRLQKKHW